MGAFDHLKKNLVPDTKYQDLARWVPPNWDYGVAPEPITLLLTRPENRNRKWLKAIAHPRVPRVHPRKGGTIEPRDLDKQRERTRYLVAMSLVEGWENVLEEDGKPMPFPEIVADPTHPGVRKVVDLLAALGEEAIDDLAVFINDARNWLDDSQPEEEEDPDAGEVRPLEKR